MLVSKINHDKKCDKKFAVPKRLVTNVWVTKWSAATHKSTVTIKYVVTKNP